MGNRKLPFGYQMRMGEIVRSEPEAKAVQDIFLQYTLGASLKEIAEQMSRSGPTYDEGKSWNKNMVARILEDSRYTGERGYPPVIDREALEKALEKRSAKQTAAPKTDTQKLLRRFSGRPSTARMER